VIIRVPKHAPTTRTLIQDLTIIRAHSWILAIGILKELKGKIDESLKGSPNTTLFISLETSSFTKHSSKCLIHEGDN